MRVYSIFLRFLYLTFYVDAVLSVSGEETPQLKSNQRTNPDLIKRQAHLITSGFSSIFWDYIQTKSNISANNNLVSDQCSSHLNRLVQSTLNGQPWAFKFLSASGSLPNNFLDGTYATFGSYDSCLQISVSQDENHGQKFRGQHCLASLEPDLIRSNQLEREILTQLYPHHFDSRYNLSIKVGFCIPSTCSQDDFEHLLTQALDEYSWRLIDINQCDIETSFIDRYKSATKGQQVFLWLLAALIFIIAFGTLIDVQVQSSIPKVTYLFWIQQFSVFKSVRSLFRKPNPGPRISRLDELRLITIIMVLNTHSLMWFCGINLSFLMEDGVNILKSARNLHVQPIFNDWLNEGLFIVGGLNAAVTLIIRMKPETPITAYLYIIFRRAAIIVPSLMVLIAIEIVLPLFGSGPIFKSVTQYRSNACVKNFIYNILHLQNYNDPLEICAAHTWSIAAEWQLFILACVLTYIYKRSNRLGLSLNILIILYGIYRSIAIILTKDLSPFVFVIVDEFKFQSIMDRMQWFYLNTEPHIWIYFCAFLIIVLVAANFDSPIDKMRQQVFTLSKCLLVFISFSPALWNVFGWKVGPIATIIILCFNKIVTVLWCYVVILAHKRAIRRYLAPAKSLDMYIHLEETSEENECEISISKSKDNQSPNNQDANSNNNIEPWTKHLNEMKKMQRMTRLHRFEIIVRLSKSVYFIHAIAYTWYFSSLRSTIPFNCTTLIMQAILLSTLSIIYGFIFHLLILGPIERINHFLSRKQIKPKSHVL